LRIRPSEGPFAPGTRVFYWFRDETKIKEQGRWMPGKVLLHQGPMVTIDSGRQVINVNESKVKKDHDEWHDVPSPPRLDDPKSPEDPPEKKERRKRKNMNTIFRLQIKIKCVELSQVEKIMSEFTLNN
jgi:hypothetical protein